MGKLLAVSLSDSKGTKKRNVPEAEIKADYGLSGDAHAGDWHRQVSLLASESIAKMTEKGLQVSAGDFAENLTTAGVELVSLPLGTILAVGEEVLLEVSQIGKECHTRCAIYYQAGDCVMPREGIFAKVLRGGRVRPGDTVTVMEGELREGSAC
jgi:MOSC domain-containing protein YiiM